MAAPVRIGTSGWSYSEWRGKFYPRGLAANRWLAHYAARFDTVELNASFYRLPAPEQFARWAEQVPDGFLFTVKASRQITHLHRLKDCGALLEKFFTAVRGLGDKLGPVLYQLPPKLSFDPALLAAFAGLLPRALSHVIEFRDPSWFRAETFGILRDHHISLCVSDLPGSPVPVIVTAPPAYLRFHGGKRYRDSYPASALQQTAAQLRVWNDEGTPSFVYFNNTAAGHAPANASLLQSSLEGLVGPEEREKDMGSPGLGARDGDDKEHCQPVTSGA